MSLNYLISIDEAKKYLYKTDVPTGANVFVEQRLEMYRSSAHRAICNKVGFEILSTVYTDERHKGNDYHDVYLDNRPITLLTAVKYNDVEKTLGDYEVIDSKYLHYEDGYFTESSYWWKFSYTAGYTSTTMPGDIKLTAVELIKLYHDASNRKAGTSSESDGATGNSISFDPDAEKNILKRLDSYVKQC